MKGGAGSQPIETGVDAAPSTAIKTTSDATYAKPNKVQRSGNKDQLDSMLGNLQVTISLSSLSLSLFLSFSSLSISFMFYLCVDVYTSMTLDRLLLRVVWAELFVIAGRHEQARDFRHDQRLLHGLR